MPALRWMIVQLKSSFTKTTSAFAHSSISASACSVHPYNDYQPLNINSGACDHATGSSHHFSSYYHVKVRIKLRDTN